MTNLEAFKEILIGTFTENQMRIFLINSGINPEDEYIKSNEKALKLAKIDSLMLLINATQSVRELDYQITERSASDLRDIIGMIYADLGMKNPLEKNKIRGRKVW